MASKSKKRKISNGQDELGEILYLPLNITYPMSISGSALPPQKIIYY